MQQSLDRDLLILLHDVARMLRTRVDRAARLHGMTRAQWVILARLARQSGTSQNELASACEVEPITVGRLIDRLEAKGLVARCADPHDRRIRRLKLLPAAQPIIDEISSYRRQMNDELVEDLSLQKRDQLIDILLTIKERLSSDALNTSNLQMSGGNM